MTGDDERLALSNRFSQEGLDVQVLSDGQKLPHVWRWLCDAETNCLSLRRQIDKLHRQHEQDLKEVEEYLEHVWKLSNDRLRQLETENKTLKKQIIINTHNNANSSNELNGKPINSNHNNGSNHTLSNGCSPALVFKQNVDNLCDSLKLKSSSKQIMQNANGDNSESDAKNSVKNISKIIGDTIDTKTANNSLNRRRNTIQYTSGPTIGAVNGVKNNSNNNNANNHHLNGEQLYALQEMCQQFKRIINQLEDKIIGLEKVNKTLEIDNETLAYKLSESQSQSDHLENQLLKLSDKKRQSISPLTAPVVESTQSSSQSSDTDPIQDQSLQLLLASKGQVFNTTGAATESSTQVAKQLVDVKAVNKRLEQELSKRVSELKELSQKYDRRKQRHREMISRLRQYMERENKELQKVLNSLDFKYKLAEEELQKHRKYCHIQDISAINDLSPT